MCNTVQQKTKAFRSIREKLVGKALCIYLSVSNLEIVLRQS